MAHFDIHIFTPYSPVCNEVECLKVLLQYPTVNFVHMRHPATSKEIIKTFLQHIPEDQIHKIVLHDYPDLAVEMNTGYQINQRVSNIPEMFRGTLSASCHSINEAKHRLLQGCQYVTLSPVFDSISKPEYKSGSILEQIDNDNRLPDGVIALGGVTPQRFAILHNAGFSGAAMLGYIHFGNIPIMRFSLNTITEHMPRV